LSASNSFTGVVTVAAGTLALGATGALGSSNSANITFTGGTLQYSASNTTDHSARIKNSSAAISIDTNGQAVTYASAIDSSNTAGLIKAGSGTLTLSGSNGYTGVTTINAGTLALGSSGALGGGGNLTFG